MTGYALCLTVVETDTKQALQSLLSTLNGYVVQDTSDPTNTTYWLGFGGTKIQNGIDPKTGQPTFIQLMGVLGYNQDDPQNVLNLLQSLQKYCTVYSPNPPQTQAQIDARVVPLAGQQGADHYWLLHPGDDATAIDANALLAKFTAF